MPSEEERYQNVRPMDAPEEPTQEQLDKLRQQLSDDTFLAKQLQQERALSDKLARMLAELRHDVRDKQKANWFSEYDEALAEHAAMREGKDG